MKNNYLLRTVFTLLLCGFFSMSYGADWYISSSGDDTTGNGSIGNPWKSFSKAQTAATSGDAIYVSGMIDMWSDPANTVFTLTAAGVFSTTNKTGITIAKNLTIQGSSSATDGFNGTNGANSTRFFTLSGVFTLTLKNLKLANGAIKTPYTTIIAGGGAISISNGNIIAENVIFDGNSVSGHTGIYGAAIAVNGSSAAGSYFKNCVFSNNVGDKGGAVYLNTWGTGTLLAPSIFQFEGCSFVSNEAKNTGGSALYIRSANEYTTCNVINCTFSKNKVSTLSNGGTINLGAKAMRYTNVNIINCTVTENTTAGSSSNGAGLNYVNTIANNIGNLYIKNTIIENNTTLAGAFSDLNVSAASPTVPETGSSTSVPGYIKIENSLIGAHISDNTRVPAGNVISSQLGYLTGSSTAADLRVKFGVFNPTTNSYSLRSTSAAIDYGAQSHLVAVSVTTDQLGATRPFTGGLCSSGAIEFSAAADEKIWKGVTSIDPAVTTNWFAGSVPSEVDFITIPKGKAFYPVYTAGLTLNGGLIESGAKLTVTDAIVNNGTLTIENNANLIQVNNVANSGSGSTTVKRNSNPLKRLDYTLWSSPVTGAQTLAQFSPKTSLAPASRFYVYDSNSNAYSNTTVNATMALFTKGAGFLIRMPNEDLATDYNAGTGTLSYPGVFTGTPNNGTASVTTSTSGYYSVGNPYPSTIDAAAFLSENTTDGTLYFWRKTNGVANILVPGSSTGTAYATWTTLGGTKSGTVVPNDIVPNGTIQVGQGFIVKSNGAELTFTNAMRLGTASTQFLKTKQQAEKSRIWINLTNTTGVFSQALVGYVADATSGVDLYDGKYINDSPIALTSNINGEQYTIQGRPAFDASDVVALNFKTDAAGDYTIAVDQTDGVFASGQDIYLVDSKTGTETDLKAGAYNFTATAGVDNARFSLKYQKTLKVDTAVFNENNVSVYNHNGILYVNSGTKAISNVKVFDVQGRLIAEQKNVKATTAVIQNLKAKNQVLIVKVTGEDNSEVSKKVMN